VQRDDLKIERRELERKRKRRIDVKRKEEEKETWKAERSPEDYNLQKKEE
jgi:hypothetical protein